MNFNALGFDCTQLTDCTNLYDMISQLISCK